MSTFLEQAIPPPENAEVLALIEPALKLDDAKLYVSTPDDTNRAACGTSRDYQQGGFLDEAM